MNTKHPFHVRLWIGNNPYERPRQHFATLEAARHYVERTVPLLRDPYDKAEIYEDTNLRLLFELSPGRVKLKRLFRVRVWIGNNPYERPRQHFATLEAARNYVETCVVPDLVGPDDRAEIYEGTKLVLVLPERPSGSG